MADFVSGEGLRDPNKTVTQITDLFQTLVKTAVNQGLPLLIRGQIYVNSPIYIMGSLRSDNTYFGELHIDGGSPGETTIFFFKAAAGDTDPSFPPGQPLFKTDEKMRASEYLKITGVKFSAPQASNSMKAVYLPNASFADVDITNCWFHNCSIEVLLARGYFSPKGGITPAANVQDPISNMTRIVGNRFTTDDTGLPIAPFAFRNGDYRTLTSGEQIPAEPRADRQIGFYFSTNHFDVYLATNQNINVATLGFGLPQGMKITNNIFKQRNLNTLCDVDMAMAAHRATFTGNTMYNCGVVMKGSLGSLKQRGYTYASTQDDKIVSNNTIIFDKAFRPEYAISLVGAYWNVVGNIIRAPRVDAKIRFGGIIFSDTDNYPILPGNIVEDPYYAIIANNLIDVRIESVKLNNNPFSVTVNQKIVTIKFPSEHGLTVGTWLKFSEGSAAGGAKLDLPVQVVAVPSPTTITASASTAATATLEGGGENVSVVYGNTSVASLSFIDYPAIVQAVISGNLFLGGNFAGLPKGRSTGKQVVSGNMWAATDYFTAGELFMVNRAAAGNIAVKNDVSHFPDLAYGLRGEPNLLYTKYYNEGSDTNFTINVLNGSFHEINTVKAVNVVGATGGSIGDTVLIKRKQGTNYSATIIHSSSFVTRTGANIVIDSDLEYVIMRKISPTVWIEESRYVSSP